MGVTTIQCRTCTHTRAAAHKRARKACTRACVPTQASVNELQLLISLARIWTSFMARSLKISQLLSITAALHTQCHSHPGPLYA
eukprot:2252375-Pleurochrysis_carterae.AAC.1